MSAKKKPAKKKPSKKTSPAADVPPQAGTPVGTTPGAPAVEIEFKDPNPDAPIVAFLNPNGAPVAVTVVKAKTVDGKDTALVHVQNGRSSETLNASEAQSKFIQDVNGVVYYSDHGFPTVTPDQKRVDIVALAS